MKRIAIILAIAAATGLHIGFGSAESLAIGTMMLSGDVLEWDGSTIIAEGHASFATNAPKTPVPADTMRLESIKAGVIQVNLVKGKNKDISVGRANATGGVVIKAKQAVAQKNDKGETIMVIRDVHATARTASLPPSQDIVELIGDVTVEITEPGLSQPIAVSTGEKVIAFLRENRFRVEGQPGKQAELTYVEKEGRKK